jgi:hypothetical protein
LNLNAIKRKRKKKQGIGYDTNETYPMITVFGSALSFDNIALVFRFGVKCSITLTLGVILDADDKVGVGTLLNLAAEVAEVRVKDLVLLALALLPVLEP